MKRWNEIPHPPLPVVIPRVGCLPDIRRGSGIVAGPIPEAEQTTVVEEHHHWLKLDYEGNIYGTETMQNFADRVEFAYGRHVTEQPCIARCYADPAHVIEIGLWDQDKLEVLLHPGDEIRGLLAAWLEALQVTELDLRSTRVRRGWKT